MRIETVFRYANIFDRALQSDCFRQVSTSKPLITGTYDFDRQHQGLRARRARSGDRREAADQNAAGEGLNAMAKISCSHLDDRSYRRQSTIVRDFNLEVDDHEFVVFLGPSGCGKSTILRMIAGLEDISGGTVAIGGAIVNDLLPRDRNVAMVFQNYALYPHMNDVRQHRLRPEADERSRRRPKSSAAFET